MSGHFSCFSASEKAYILNYFATNEISNADCTRVSHAHWARRTEYWGAKAGTCGFAFSAKAWADPIISRFLTIACNVVYGTMSCCGRARVSNYTDWRITGLNQAGIDFSKVGGGFWMDFNAKDYDNWKPVLQPGEALEWIMAAAQGRRIDLSRYLSPRKRRDGHYAVPREFRALLEGKPANELAW